MKRHRLVCTLSLLWATTLPLVQAQDVAPNPALPEIPDRVLKLTDFGAVGDGQTLNTAAFARAITAMAEHGGGELVVPPGCWLTGPISLCSHLNLHLERGAWIKFATDFHLYPLTVINTRGEKEVDSTSPIFGQDLESVAITGEGIIDGGGNAWRPVKKSKLNEGEWKSLVKSGGVLTAKGDAWWPSTAAMQGEEVVAALRAKGSVNPADYEPAHQYLRPKMLHLLDCRRVLLAGVTFQNPPNWTMNPALCTDVSILNVTVHNLPAAQNSDALDLESCRHAVIKDCTFDTGDDGICIKAGKDAVGRRIGVPTEDVLVTGCTVYHAHGGFTIGSEMSGGVRQVRVTNCTFIGTEVGLRFKSRRGRGGVVQQIYVDNIRMADIVGDAINFNSYYGGKSNLEDADTDGSGAVPPVDVGTPQFRDIHIHQVVCRGAKAAIVLQGLPEMPLRDIDLTGVAITASQGVTVTDGDSIRFKNVQVTTAATPPLTQTRVKNSTLEVRQ